MNLGWRVKCHSWRDILWLAPCGDLRVGWDTFPADITLLIGKHLGHHLHAGICPTNGTYTLLCMTKMVSLVTSWICSPDHYLMSDFWGFVLCKFASLSIKLLLFHYSSYHSLKCTFHVSQLCSIRNKWILHWYCKLHSHSVWVSGLV